jgi:hypothetical protein
MVSPQPTDAHLRIAHSIEEEIMMRDFTKRQRSIMDLILRLSWGCGRKLAVIPKQKDFEIVGIPESKIKSELEWLKCAKVIFWSRDTNAFSFNKNYDEWRVSIVPGYNKQRLTELVNINLHTSQNGNLIDEKAIFFTSRGKESFGLTPTEFCDTGPPKESTKEITITTDDIGQELPKTASFTEQSGRLPGAPDQENDSDRLPGASDEPHAVEEIGNYYLIKTGRFANSNDYVSITDVLDRPLAVPLDYKSRIEVIKQAMDRISGKKTKNSLNTIKSFSYFKDGILEEFRKIEITQKVKGDDTNVRSSSETPDGNTRQYGNGIIDYNQGFSNKNV